MQKNSEKTGFKLEGLMRDYEFEYGHYVDIEIYSILKREYNVCCEDKKVEFEF